jgi:LPXTG-motif cell wall-anchored protein
MSTTSSVRVHARRACAADGDLQRRSRDREDGERRQERGQRAVVLVAEQAREDHRHHDGDGVGRQRRHGEARRLGRLAAGYALLQRPHGGSVDALPRVHVVIRARRLLPLTCALALAFPASAFAGGAGDDQYQDPFADDQPAQTQSAPAPQGSAPAQEAAPQADSGAGTPAPSATPAAPSLPRTGADAGLIAAGGGVLLAAGLALRRRAADGVPR